MIDKDLLEILACPETHQSLAVAEPALIERVNARIVSGKQLNKAGQPVSEKIVEALVRSDRQLVYPIRDGIPVLLIDEGLPLA